MQNAQRKKKELLLDRTKSFFEMIKERITTNAGVKLEDE
jgi:hypothetical protein